jgi:hypothetical protein
MAQFFVLKGASTQLRTTLNMFQPKVPIMKARERETTMHIWSLKVIPLLISPEMAQMKIPSPKLTSIKNHFTESVFCKHAAVVNHEIGSERIGSMKTDPRLMMMFIILIYSPPISFSLLVF